MSSFPFSTAIPIRFNDVDALKHVNNAVFVTYFEIGRMDLFQDMAWEWERDGLIVARHEINYIKPIYLTDKPVIHLGIEKIGTKSFDVVYKITNQKEELVADGKTVLVVYDYTLGKAKPLSDESRAKLEKYLVTLS